MRNAPTIILLAALSLIGCGGPAGEQIGAVHGHVALSEQEIAAILALVNHRGTDLVLLDDAVGLDRRAAENIIAVRSGADEVLGTSDDVTISALDQLDAIPWVGTAALDQLRTYAMAHPLPQSEIVEGVMFSGEQVEAVVWGVNQATLAELDDDVALDVRAAEGLVAGAPWQDVSGMGEVSHVGPSALEKLRDYADRVWLDRLYGDGQAGTYDGVVFDGPTATIALEIANDASADVLTDVAGIYPAGVDAIVANRPHASLADVAATPGVGPATMEALHALAVSDAWPPAGCALDIAPVADPLLDGYDADLRAFDPAAPYHRFRFGAYQLPACADLDAPETTDALYALLIAHADWASVIDDYSHLVTYHDELDGAVWFRWQLENSIGHANDFIAEYPYDQQQSAMATYDALEDQAVAIRDRIDAADASSRSLRIQFSPPECTREVVLVVDEATGLIYVAYHAGDCI